MRSRRSFLRSLLLALPAGVVACTEDNLSVITPSTLEVTAVTLGVDRDLDGYTVQLDTRPAQVLGLVETFRDLRVAPGTHRVLLGGLASNCVVEGENPRTLTIGPGELVRVTFEVTCSTTLGTLNLRTVTNGPRLDSDGYIAIIDGRARDTLGTRDGVNVGGLGPGEHMVELDGIGNYCAVEGANPRGVTITPGEIAGLTFTVTCIGGTIRVSVTTGGVGSDPDGYDVLVGGTAVGHLGPNEEIAIPDLMPGPHGVQLSQVAANCIVEGANPVEVGIPQGGEASISFAVDCPATAAPYQLIDLGTLPGGCCSEAYGINAAGQVVGYSTAEGFTHAFLWDKGVMVDLGTLGGSYSVAWAINAAGQIVGTSATASLGTHATLWENGVPQDLGTLGGEYSVARGINDAGQVVGESGTAGGEMHAFLWDNGVMIDLGTLGGSYSTAHGINNAGQVVGWSHRADGVSGPFLWERGRMTDLGTLGGCCGVALGLNDQGSVVGYEEGSGRTHAFIWQHGAISGLPGLDGTSSQAAGISPAGVVVGHAEMAPWRPTAAMWDDGILAILPGEYGWAYAINATGQIVGASGGRAILWIPK
jgi:probable HAF family extracellular repeat protein